MPRRLFALFAGLSLMAAGCGTVGADKAAPTGDPPSPPASAARVDPATAEKTFALLADLDEAWRQRDCAAVADLTAWAEKTLGGRACEATRNGRPAPTRKTYADPEFLLPDDGDWFAALAREPEPAYFVFVLEDGRWRLGAGPIPVTGKLPGHGKDAAPDPDTARRARLVPQRHLTYLTDPVGVSGVRFPASDPVRTLLDELTGRPDRAKPDRLAVDVELVDGPTRALALPGGSMLVFDALRLVFHQRPAAGRTTLSHPLYGPADLKAFTGKPRPAEVTGTELVILASEITTANKLKTIALRRTLADLT